MRKSYVALAMLPIALGLGFAPHTSTSGYASLDERGDPLRATFNADVGKVRVLMLVAPT